MWEEWPRKQNGQCGGSEMCEKTRRGRQQRVIVEERGGGEWQVVDSDKLGLDHLEDSHVSFFPQLGGNSPGLQQRMVERAWILK